MQNSFSLFALLSALSTFVVTAALGCDTCGCYLPADDAATAPSALRWVAGVGEQFTHFGTDRLNGREVPNLTGQYLDSSITQLVAGYRFTDRFSVQVGLPLIYRSFKRPDGFEIQKGTESGLGDMTLLGSFNVYRTANPIARSEAKATLGRDAKSERTEVVSDANPFFFSLNVLAGIKLPTGSPRRLKEELAESDVEGAPPSGVHGHDLALGSGSFDGIVGFTLFAGYRPAFFQADGQYAIRTQGSYSYRYANAFSYSGGPGYYFFDRAGTRVGLQLVISGESKGKDRFQGHSAGDTGIDGLFAGQRILVSFRDRLTAEVSADLPVVTHSTSFQTTADYRTRAGVTLRF